MEERQAVPLATTRHDRQIQLTAITEYGQLEGAVSGGQLEVEHILNCRAVNGNDAVVRLNSGARCGAFNSFNGKTSGA
jgi:hypothetical protein